jgi:hypothetical protein
MEVLRSWKFRVEMECPPTMYVQCLTLQTTTNHAFFLTTRINTKLIPIDVLAPFNLIYPFSSQVHPLSFKSSRFVHMT